MLEVLGVFPWHLVEMTPGEVAAVKAKVSAYEKAARKAAKGG